MTGRKLKPEIRSKPRKLKNINRQVKKHYFWQFSYFKLCSKPVTVNKSFVVKLLQVGPYFAKEIFQFFSSYLSDIRGSRYSSAPFVLKVRTNNIILLLDLSLTLTAKAKMLIRLHFILKSANEYSYSSDIRLASLKPLHGVLWPNLTSTCANLVQGKG